MHIRAFQPWGVSLLLVSILFCTHARLGAQSGASQSQPEKQPQPGKQSAAKKEKKLPRISGYVVVVSISGVPAEAISKPEELRLRIPTIRALRARGAFTPNVEGVFPSLSAPAHASLLTGTSPVDHGVTADFPIDLQTGVQAEAPYRLAKELKGETIWEYLRREGLTSAAVDFPLSIGANLPYNFHDPAPEETQEETGVRNEVLKSLGPRPSPGPKAKPLALAQSRDELTAAAASKLMEMHHPNLTMIRFSSYEAAERFHGRSSPESLATLELIDGLIAKITAATELAGIAPETTYLLVTDHCGMKNEREFHLNSVLAKKKWTSSSGKKEPDETWKAVAQPYGGSAAIYVRNPQDEALIKEIEACFMDLHKKPDSAIWRVLTRRDAAQLGADSRAVLFLDAAPFCAFSAQNNGLSPDGPETRVAYGYSPARSEMRTGLLLAGKGIKTNPKFEFARLVDVAPTIARLFGLEMKTTRGRALTEAFAQ